MIHQATKPKTKRTFVCPPYGGHAVMKLGVKPRVVSKATRAAVAANASAAPAPTKPPAPAEPAT
jgi:hypothetical protein